MNYEIKEIEGIGPVYAEKLARAEITSTGKLLDLCASPAGRKQVAAATGIGEGLLLKWTNLADLMRVSGIGPQFSELLEAAGVDTIKELRNRNAANLAATMEKVNGEKNLSRTSPAEATVIKWIEAAKTMEPKLTY